MIVSVHQPHYLPWSGYFDKIDSADVFVLLDCVQFEKNGWQNRNRIKTSQGESWLTVPVLHDFGQLINETLIDNKMKWRQKHIKSIITNYSRAPFFKQYINIFENIYLKEWEDLSTLNTEMLFMFSETIGVKTKIRLSSDLKDLPIDPNQRLVEIVKHYNGDCYLAGKGSLSYIDTDLFEKNGIKVIFQEYSPEIYPQLYGEFIPGLSLVDMIFNVGNESYNIIKKGRRTLL